MFVDYYNHYRALNGGKTTEYQTITTSLDGVIVPISFAEKEEKLNAALRREIMRVAGVSDISQFPVESWANHPMLKWATFAVVSAMIDMILPDTIIDSIGIYSDVPRLVGAIVLL